jgi:hypothetical protein
MTLLVPALLACGLGSTAMAQTAISLQIGVAVTDDLVAQQDARLYKVTPGPNQHLIVLLQKPTGFASRLDLKFKTAPTDLDYDDTDGGPSDGTDQAVEAVLTKTGSYFIRVLAECCDAGGPYTIVAYTRSMLTQLTIGQPLIGGLPRQGAEQYYLVSPGADQHLVVTLEKDSGFASRLEINFKLLPTDSNVDASDGGARDQTDQAVEIRLTKAGDYFIRTSAECCDAGGPYTITAQTLATLPDLTDGVPISDALQRQLGERYYTVSTRAGEHLTVSLLKTPPFTSRLDIRLGQLPTDGAFDDSVGGDHDESDQSVDIASTKAGTYFVRVSATCCDDPGNYTIAAQTLTPPACVGACVGSDVTVNDLLIMVNIALGTSPLSACTAGDANGDTQITVDEILTAVRNALNGCLF